MIPPRRSRERALTGVRVLELADDPSASYCGLVLADLGADVVKVEFRSDARLRRASESANDFALRNRNKRSIQLDLGVEAARPVFYRLVRTADAIVESYPVGAMDRLGLGYERVIQEAPRLVYCSLTGYGQDGPYADRVGHDLNFASVAGLVDQTGVVGESPTPLPIAATEVAGGLYAAVSLLAALRARDRIGRGQKLDVSLSEAGLTLLGTHLAAGWSHGVAPQRGRGPLSGGLPGYGIYRTSDGRYLSLAAAEDARWRRLCELTGLAEIAPLRDSPDGAVEVARRLELAIAERTREEWTELLADDDTCAAPVLSLDEVLRDPHFVHRGVFSSVLSASGDRLPQIGFPVRLPLTPAVMSPPPELGEHTQPVLEDLGYSTDELEELRAEGVFA